MKANRNTVLVGTKVVLVPYRSEHVLAERLTCARSQKYHEWMQDEELRTLTASEPLTLDEEYDMQQKWQLDEDKLTFIILSREAGQLPADISPTDPRLSDLPMVGDVNMFLYGTPPVTNTNDLKPTTSNPHDEDEDDEFYAEVEIMIAESSFRRKGLAIEGLQLMLAYATGQSNAFSTDSSSSIPGPVPLLRCPLQISPERLVTRISDTNLASIRLFEKLGFQITKRVEVFKEVEMRWRGSALR